MYTPTLIGLNARLLADLDEQPLPFFFFSFSQVEHELLIYKGTSSWTLLWRGSDPSLLRRKVQVINSALFATLSLFVSPFCHVINLMTQT